MTRAVAADASCVGTARNDGSADERSALTRKLRGNPEGDVSKLARGARPDVVRGRAPFD